MSDLPRIITGLQRQIEELRRRARGRSREGVVTQVDAAQGLFRVNVGTDERPFVTGWIPAEALSSGALRIQAEPTMGQRVRVTSESGDLTDGVVALSSFNTDSARPHGAVGELKVSVGGSEITTSAGSLVLESNGSRITISAAGVVIESSALTHNGKNVGATHTHSGVQTGGGSTGAPN